MGVAAILVNATYQVLWKIGQLVPEKILKGFTIYGRGCHLGHVTNIMSSEFHFLLPESFHKKFGPDRQSSF